MYLDIFTESFISTFWPSAVEVTATAMQIFDVGNPSYIAASAVAGCLAAVFVLWWLGRGLFALSRHMTIRMSDERYSVLQQSVNKVTPWLLVVVWLPWGFMVVLTAGFFRVPLLTTLAISVVGLGFYYATRIG